MYTAESSLKEEAMNAVSVSELEKYLFHLETVPRMTSEKLQHVVCMEIDKMEPRGLVIWNSVDFLAISTSINTIYI